MVIEILTVGAAIATIFVGLIEIHKYYKEHHKATYDFNHEGEISDFVDVDQILYEIMQGKDDKSKDYTSEIEMYEIEVFGHPTEVTVDMG